MCVRERERVQTDWIHSFDVMYIRWNSIERFGQDIVHGGECREVLRIAGGGLLRTSRLGIVECRSRYSAGGAECVHEHLCQVTWFSL